MVAIKGIAAGAGLAAGAATQTAKGAIQVARSAREAGLEFVGYDVIGLFSRIAMIYVMATIVYLWIKTTTGFATGITSFLALFGITVPGPPEFLIDFVNKGIVFRVDPDNPVADLRISHIDYWEVVNVIVLVSLVAEGYLYYTGAQKTGKANPLVLGFFAVAGMGIALVGFAKHIGMARDWLDTQGFSKAIQELDK